ncbi:MAG: substrate-binding domain-containing protein [Gammaproteobacteria bacterium]|nr:substrate-binding domain-containing protein [Gammaproteobacteria bacterium]
MRYINHVLTAFQASVFLGLSFASLPAVADTLKVGGTGSALGTMKILAEAYRASRPDTQIMVVPALGSSGSIKAVAAGVLDIGLSGRPLKPAEREQNLAEREVARTPLVLASMRAHAGFTLSDIVRVYDGTLQTWPDGSPLRPILRPESDSETALLRAISPEIDRALTTAHARPGVHIAITDQDSADAIEHIPGGLGPSTLALILSEQRKIRALPLNGVAPSVAALRRGSYPYFKPLYLVTPQNPSGPARAFAAFIQTRQGARILSDNGYLPLQSGGK